MVFVLLSVFSYFPGFRVCTYVLVDLKKEKAVLATSSSGPVGFGPEP
jgi:hypothetical protein